jgi:hypothetical protein
MLCIFAQPALATSAISVEPAYIDVWQGDEFTVNITVNPEESAVYGGSYTLYFNNTLLNATTQIQGPFLTQDGQSSNVWWNEIDNTTGKVEYSESRQGTEVGVSNPGVLATIIFQVIGDEGISALIISDYNGELLYSSSPPGPILTDIYNGRVGIAQSSTPFLLHGYVSYDDGSDCNYPAVNVTNLNTSEEWTAEKDASSNYYQLMLSSCADVIAGDILRFDLTSPDGSSNITEHTVTQAEVGAGGFEYNITLEFRPPGDVNGDGKITSADATIALQMAVCGEYDPAADVNHDDSVTSLDALMIMQAANDIL